MRIENSVTISIRGEGPHASESVRHVIATISQSHAYSIARLVTGQGGETASILLVSEYDDGKDDGLRTAYEARTEAPKDGGGDRTETPEPTGIKAEDATKPAEEPECDCPACQFRAVLARAIGVDRAEVHAKDGIRVIRIPIGG